MGLRGPGKLGVLGAGVVGARGVHFQPSGSFYFQFSLLRERGIGAGQV